MQILLFAYYIDVVADRRDNSVETVNLGRSMDLSKVAVI